MARCRVSIRAPTRGATAGTLTPSTVRTRFNPRAHEGRDGSATGDATVAWTFQSARPRGARRRPPVVGDALPAVSIRAPTRGATRHDPRPRRLDRVSIRAPTRGATRARSSRSTAATRFNPRAHEGRDRDKSCSALRCPRFQSARPRGARPRRALITASCSRMFQSARPRGARHDGSVVVHSHYQFQSARPRGARPCCAARARGAQGFNPRAHEGRDRRTGESGA